MREGGARAQLNTGVVIFVIFSLRVHFDFSSLQRDTFYLKNEMVSGNIGLLLRYNQRESDKKLL